MQYIKMLIMSLITGIFGPLASSSSAHFVFLNKVLNFSDDSNEVNFYFSIVSIMFAVVGIFFVRKIYSKGFKSVFAGKSKKIANAEAYKSMMTGVLISLIPVLVMCIPMSKTTFLFDVFDNYLTGSSMLVCAFCCFASGFLLLVALWYAKNKNIVTHRSSEKKDVVRMSLYQIPAFIFPGFSHVCSSAACMEISGVDDRTIMREIFIFMTPSTLLINIIRVIRCITLGVSINFILILVCVLASLAGSIVIFNLVSKINVRRSFLFFSIYSILLGICMGVVSFV
ncbi:MAG: undecaprenyl-diphosphate phosphatase [Acutalibacteraceae bacterium]